MAPRGAASRPRFKGFRRFKGFKGFKGLWWRPSGAIIMAASRPKTFTAGLRPWKTDKPRLSVSRLKGRPFYGQAMGQLRLTCTFSAECAQRVEMHPFCRLWRRLLHRKASHVIFKSLSLPYKSRSLATPEGEILAALYLELLMNSNAKRRENFPLRGKWCAAPKGVHFHGRSPVVWFSAITTMNTCRPKCSAPIVPPE